MYQTTRQGLTSGSTDFMTDRFFYLGLFLVSSLLFFCLVPCGGLHVSWLFVSLWAHVNVMYHVVSYHYRIVV